MPENARVQELRRKAAKLEEERNTLANSHGDTTKINELDRQIRQIRAEAINEWRRTADLTQLDQEPQITIPKSVFDELLMWFKSGHSCEDHVEFAFDADSIAALRATQLCFPEPPQD